MTDKLNRVKTKFGDLGASNFSEVTGVVPDPRYPPPIHNISYVSLSLRFGCLLQGNANRGQF